MFERRDELKFHLNSRGIDAKIHYPKPVYLQPAAKQYGYKRGDFPMAERVSMETLSLPVHEFITKDDLDYMISEIREFYGE